MRQVFVILVCLLLLFSLAANVFMVVYYENKIELYKQSVAELTEYIQQETSDITPEDILKAVINILK
jgi:hypothetical protein